MARCIDKPGPASNFGVKDISPSSVTLRWSEPRDDGGADVTAYVVEKREASRRMWQSVATVPPDVTELEAGGLYEGNQYVFRVTAENVVGLGEPAELKDTVVPKSQFGQFAWTLVSFSPFKFFYHYLVFFSFSVLCFLYVVGVVYVLSFALINNNNNNNGTHASCIFVTFLKLFS